MRWRSRITRFLTLLSCVATISLTQPASFIGIGRHEHDAKTPATTEKRHHIFVYSCIAYSHCQEIYGAVLTLVDTGKFEATIFVPESCVALIKRAVEVSNYREHFHIFYADLLPGKSDELEQQFKAAEHYGSLTNTAWSETKEDYEVFFEITDEFLRRRNFSLAYELHAKHPFDVAICDVFSPACYEFADQLGIVGIQAGVQGPPSKRDLEHNGLWLLACPRSPSACSLTSRIAALYDIFVPFDLPFVRSRVQHDEAILFVREIAVELRDKRRKAGEVIPPLREQYPLIDQQVRGTVKPAAYYRSDHAIVGPTWLKLQQSKLNASHDLTRWIEQHSGSDVELPIIYVSFGTVTRFNKTEIAMLLEGIVSDRWRTIWKTNTKYSKEILSDENTKLSKRARELATNTDFLQAVEWSPQYALFHHPNVKASVTHGGMSTMMEAYAAGIPLVCVPILGDQPYNCQQAKELGVAVLLPRSDFTAQALQKSIERVLFDGGALAKRMDEVSRYHASIDAARLLSEFVAQYAQFKYEFGQIADDSFSWWTYWNAELWVILLGTATISTIALFLLTAFIIKKFQNTKRQEESFDASKSNPLNSSLHFGRPQNSTKLKSLNGQHAPSYKGYDSKKTE